MSIKIEIEGTDGAGKTTGLKYLIEKLQAAGKTVVETREVGNPHIPMCVKLRELVLDPNSNLSGEAMEAVFTAMRFENDRWQKSLEESGAAPDMIVSDRGLFSHLAYTDHNVSMEFTDKFYLGAVAEFTKMPDVVIYFRVNTDTALQRRVKRGTGMDVIEMKGVGYQELVRTSFEEYLDMFSAVSDVQIFEVDANQDINGVRNQLDAIANQLLKG